MSVLCIIGMSSHYVLIPLSLSACRHKDYHLYSDVRPSSLIPVNICRPLEMSGLTEVVQTAKECLGNNFVPAFLTIAGS